jgi:ABC-type Fe3+-siderophore transport system permease subunit
VAIGGTLAFAWYLMPLGRLVGRWSWWDWCICLRCGNAQYTNNDLILAGVALAALAERLDDVYHAPYSPPSSRNYFGFLLGSATIVGWDAVGLMVASVVIGMTMLMICGA